MKKIAVGTVLTIAMLVIATLGIIRIASAIRNTTSQEAERPEVAQPTKQLKGVHRIGRIDVTSSLQGFEVPEGYTYHVEPVQPIVTLRKVVNGNIDMGSIVLSDGSVQPAKKFNTVGRVMRVDYEAATANEVGKSLIVIIHREGTPRPKGWEGIAVTKAL